MRNIVSINVVWRRGNDATLWYTCFYKMDSGVLHHTVPQMYDGKERILEEDKAVVVIREAIGGSFPLGFDFVYYIPGGRGGKLLWYSIFF